MTFQETHIFSTKITCIRFEDIRDLIKKALGGKKKMFLFPMNIHVLGALSYSSSFRAIHNNSSIVFADGVPLIWLSYLTHRHLPERISGTLLTETVLKTMKDIYLIGPNTHTLKRIQSIYSQKNSQTIVGNSCPPHKEEWDENTNKTIIRNINRSGAKIVLVGVGPLKQEKWILQYASKTNALIFIAVGSALEILSGEKPRAPQWMQTIGMEWIWRIILEPKRLGWRYCTDLFLFVTLLIKSIQSRVQFSTRKYTWWIVIVCIAIWMIYANLSTHGQVSYRSNPARTGVYTDPSIGTPEWWRFTANGLLTSTPVSSNGSLYVSGWEDHTIYALDGKTGVLRWHFTAEGDIPFAPTVYNGSIFVGSVDGHLYALGESDGSIKWRYSSKELTSITTHAVITNNTVIFGGRDGMLHALDASSGKEKWSFKTNGPIESSPLLFEGAYYFGSFDGNMYAVDAKTGKEVWRFHTNKPILSSPAISNGKMVFGGEDSFVYAFRLRDKKLLWKSKTNGPIDGTPAIKNNTVLIANLVDSIYAIHVDSGEFLWQKTIPTGPHAGFAVDETTAYIGSSDTSLYAFNIASGVEVWKYTTTQPITAAPTIINDTIYSTSGMYVYALQKRTGQPYTSVATFSVPNSPTAGKIYEPIEFTIKLKDALYTNPWNEASLSAKFTSEQGETIHIDGFYYDKDEWKIRFSPNKIGTWTWSITHAPTPSSKQTVFGKLSIERGTNKGFMRLSSQDRRTFRLDDDSPFYPVGIGDSILDTAKSDANGTPLDNFSADENTTNISIDHYANLYGKDGAGFNLFRWSVDNASFRLWESDYDPFSPRADLWETYPTRYGRWGDSLVETLRANGFHIWFSFWSFLPNPKIGDAYAYKIRTMEAYMRYVVARYGAYVDVWELTNESSAPTEWIQFAIKTLHKIDPYHHPISISWERPDIDGIEITSPHWYETEDISQSDIATIREIEKYTKWNKPIVFGEQGNKGVNWDPLSGIRMRIRLWTAYFNNASLVFWNTSNSKDYHHPLNANIYIGKEERQYVKTFRNYIKDRENTMITFTLQMEESGIRSYAYKTSNGIQAYFFHYASPLTETEATLRVDLQGEATANWIDTTTGIILQTSILSEGVNIIHSPVFSTDVALKISYK